MKEARKQAVREEEQGRTGRGKVEEGQEAGWGEEEKGGMVREIGIKEKAELWIRIPRDPDQRSKIRNLSK